jgi:serine/threonine-protein kinase
VQPPASSSSVSAKSPVPSQSQFSPSAPSISQQEAVDVIQQWQEAKAVIFAPPFDRQRGAELLTGKAYSDNLGATGSLDWLLNNNAYYTYSVQKIEQVEQFVTSGNQATIDIVITEERTLYKDGKVVRDGNTSLDTRLVRYTLQSENGRWKIADYKTVTVLRKS